MFKVPVLSGCIVLVSMLDAGSVLQGMEDAAGEILGSEFEMLFGQGFDGSDCHVAV